MVNLKGWLCAAIGAFGGIVCNLLGGMTVELQTLVILMVADYITGLIVAIVFKASTKTESGGASSIVGFKGIFKKVGVLIAVALAHRIDLTLGVAYLTRGVVYAYIANESLSLIENLGLMGVPMPDIVVKAIDVLKTKSKKDE